MLSIPYEQRKQERVERLKERAERLRKESDAKSIAGWSRLEAIPFGQPILCGHHSEKSDRSYRAKATGLIDKSVELSKEADRVERRAEAAESNDVISSDDPNAVEKLTAKLATLEERRERIKAENAAARKAGQERPYPEYVSSNLSGNIGSIKKRIELLKRKNEAPPMEPITTDKSVIIHDTDINRYRITFPAKPCAETIAALKSSGFRWSPSVGSWVAYVNVRTKWQIGRLIADNAI